MPEGHQGHADAAGLPARSRQRAAREAHRQGPGAALAARGERARRLDGRLGEELPPLAGPQEFLLQDPRQEPDADLPR